MQRIERGVMVMKNGKAWGIESTDDHSTYYGWMDPTQAPIHDPQFCKQPTDVTWKDSPYTRELATAKLVPVIRTTTVQIEE